MGIDKRGVSRGKCTECNECDEYETSGSNILCEYCRHRPVQHEVISQISASGSQVGSELEPPEKRSKPAEEEEQNNDVSDGENEVTMIDNAECCANDNTHREDDLVSNNRALFHVVCTDVFIACSRRSDSRAREKNSGRNKKNEGRLEGEGGRERL